MTAARCRGSGMSAGIVRGPWLHDWKTCRRLCDSWFNL